jgi:hypothetical protein
VIVYENRTEKVPLVPKIAITISRIGWLISQISTLVANNFTQVTSFGLKSRKNA